jgi:hypothetical protein
MALEQNAETVHLLVRASLDRRGFRPKLAMIAQQYVDQRRFHAQHRAECGKQQFLLKLQMVGQPILEERTNVLGAQFGLALGQVAGAQSPRQQQCVMMLARKRNQTVMPPRH